MADIILVTGGCGFIGTNFIRYVLGRTPHSVVNLDKLTYAGNPENLKAIEKNPRFIKNYKGDIADKVLVPQILEQYSPRYIVNFAAESHVDRALKDADPFWHSNVHGVFSLLSCVRDYNEQKKENGIERFMQISTDEVYGSVKEGSFSEDAPLNPTGPYPITKAVAESIARDFCNLWGLPVIITRSSNNFGPYQYPEKLISLFVTNKLQGRRLPLMWSADNPGLNIRDWIYVEDNVRALWTVLEKGKIGEVYNIPGGNEFTNRQITEFILNSFGVQQQDYNCWIEPVKHREGHDFRYSITGDKIKELGWKPTYSGSDGFLGALFLTVQWYATNQVWWMSLKAKGDSWVSQIPGQGDRK